jgi:predicted nucleic acid binding AN1-type Zn finger protein
MEDEINHELVVKKQRCKYSNCEFNVMKLIGKCKSCKYFYCRIHRLPEIHKCKYLLEIKEKERIKLDNKLMNERTKFTYNLI